MLKSLRWIVCLYGMVALTAVAADVPQLINFQGRLDDDTGQTVADSVYSVTFRLFDDPQFGVLLWEETQNVTTSGGVFSVMLGGVQPLPDSAFAVDSCYLEIQISGSDPISPRARITSVAYARRAGSAVRLDGVNIADLEESAEITAAIVDHSAFPNAHHQKTMSAGELVTGTLAEARLPQKAIDASELEDNSITSAQISDEPGLAHTYTALTLLPTTISVIDSSLIYAPTVGYVVVIVSGYFYSQHLVGGELSATLSLSTSRTTHDYTYSARFEVRAGAPTGHTTENFVIQRVQTVAAGNTKFFLLGNRAGTEIPNVQNVQINTFFIPTSYGEIDATSAAQ